MLSLLNANMAGHSADLTQPAAGKASAASVVTGELPTNNGADAAGQNAKSAEDFASAMASILSQFTSGNEKAASKPVTLAGVPANSSQPASFEPTPNGIESVTAQPIATPPPSSEDVLPTPTPIPTNVNSAPPQPDSLALPQWLKLGSLKLGSSVIQTAVRNIASVSSSSSPKPTVKPSLVTSGEQQNTTQNTSTPQASFLPDVSSFPYTITVVDLSPNAASKTVNTAAVSALNAPQSQVTAPALSPKPQALRLSTPELPARSAPDFFSFGLTLTTLSNDKGTSSLSAAAQSVISALSSRSAASASAVSAQQPQPVSSPKTTPQSAVTPSAAASSTSAGEDMADGESAWQEKPKTIAGIAPGEPSGTSSSNQSSGLPQFTIDLAGGNLTPSKTKVEQVSSSSAVASTTGQPPEAKQMLVRLEGKAGETISIRLVDQGGQVQVSVRSTNPSTAEHLRSDLSTLTANLEKTGWKADVLTTIASNPDAMRASTAQGSFSEQQQQPSSDSTPDKRQQLVWNEDDDSNKKSSNVADLWDEILNRQGSTLS